MRTLDAGFVEGDSPKVGLKNFLKEYYEGNHVYKYRNKLKANFHVGEFWINVNLEELDAYEPLLSDKLKKNPGKLMELFEQAATEVCDEITTPRKEGSEIVPNIQVMINSCGVPISPRNLSADLVSKLVTVSGIIVSASPVCAKATHLTLQCKGCHDTRHNVHIERGLNGYVIPRKCSNHDKASDPRLKQCPLDPYYILYEKSKFIDRQTLKLQESTEDTPQGGMPRHLQLYCDRYLCDTFVPGNRVTLHGVFSIIKSGKPTTSNKGYESNVNVDVKSSYLNVVGYKIETKGPGHSSTISYTPAEEEEFRAFAASSDCYERIYKSIAPSIFGFDDVKKAIAALLFSGSVKNLPDNTRRRGDINVLLLGDPGTAKSQILKFVEQVAPIGVYTSGKGSSAAGLTASVMRNKNSGSFVVEGGAMVLADGGVVCIDEFDKMREDDRVAIHEAMEQQTISIAKAGITVTLNSRCAVLAAANSAHGRWDDYVSNEENIDFMPTILSRFDMIFVIKDKHEEAADRRKSLHITNIHANSEAMQRDGENSDALSLDFLKKYISFCRSNVGPRVSESASRNLIRRYVDMRNGPEPNRSNESQGINENQCDIADHENKSVIPITVRQLEATIRISEALAKMQLRAFATEEHIDESLRLFKESTLKASEAGHLTGAEGFVTDSDRETMTTIEKQITRRLSHGLVLHESKLINEFVKEHADLHLLKLVIQSLVRQSVLTRKGVARGMFVCCKRF